MYGNRASAFADDFHHALELEGGSIDRDNMHGSQQQHEAARDRNTHAHSILLIFFFIDLYNKLFFFFSFGSFLFLCLHCYCSSQWVPTFIADVMIALFKLEGSFWSPDFAGLPPA